MVQATVKAEDRRAVAALIESFGASVIDCQISEANENDCVIKAAGVEATALADVMRRTCKHSFKVEACNR